MAKQKNTKVVHRKLGKEQAWGIAHIEHNKIEVDIRLHTKKYMEIFLHEKMHLLNPDWSETKIIKQSKSLANFLWQNNFRWCDL